VNLWLLCWFLIHEYLLFPSPSPSSSSSSSSSSFSVLRVYGTTPVGQKVCLHLHDYFPYLYVMLNEEMYQYLPSPPDDLRTDAVIDPLHPTVSAHLQQLGQSIETILNSAPVSNSSSSDSSSLSMTSRPRKFHRDYVYKVVF
jgi:DNA polymerase zeta